MNEKETEGRLVFEIGNGQWNIPELRKLLQKILPQKTTIYNFEVTHTFEAIGDRTMLLNAREIIREDSGEKLILLAFGDITDKKITERNLEKSEAKFRHLADFMPQKVWVADEQGEVNYCNQNWLDYSGMTLKEIQDKDWNIIHPDDREAYIRQWQSCIATGKDFEIESRFLNEAGEYKWHLTRSLPYKDDNGTITMWVGTNTEIEEQKKQREELEKAVQQRTAELQLANTALAEKNVELLNKNKELSSFTYVSSHDLQEPLRKIQTFINMLLTKEHDTLSNQAKDYFQRIHNAARRMQTLIEDLLAYSLTDTTEPKFEQTNLADILEEVRVSLSEIILEKDATIETNELCAVSIIPFQMRQVLHNLISNSLKFSRKDVASHIVINSAIATGRQLKVEKLDANKSYCHLTFTDNGIGFDPQYNDKIFQVFQRLHGKEEYAGTGIGLAIVKKIIDNHNGLIIAGSEPGKGSTFNIYIPAS